jgi:hypothetical protein
MDERKDVFIHGKNATGHPRAPGKRLRPLHSRFLSGSQKLSLLPIISSYTSYICFAMRSCV